MKHIVPLLLKSMHVFVFSLTMTLYADGVLAQDAEPHKDDSLPSLDALLGTEEGNTHNNNSTPSGEDTSEETLDRMLSGREIVEEFRAAADLMARSARRISAQGDTGLTTQRMQEDILRKLDMLIADAEQRSNQNGTPSSSDANSQSQNRQQPQQGAQQRNSTGENRTESDSPGGQDGPLGPERAGDLASWGSLPSRIRDALLQGANDRFSTPYRMLTEAYYRRLAEEPKQ